MDIIPPIVITKLNQMSALEDYWAVEENDCVIAYFKDTFRSLNVYYVSDTQVNNQYSFNEFAGWIPRPAYIPTSTIPAL